MGTEKETIEKKVQVFVGKHLARKDGRYIDARHRNLLETRYALNTRFYGNQVKTGSIARSDLTMDKLIGYLNGIFDVEYLGENIHLDFNINSNMGNSFGSYTRRTKNGKVYYATVANTPKQLNCEELRCILGKVPSIRKWMCEH